MHLLGWDQFNAAGRREEESWDTEVLYMPQRIEVVDHGFDEGMARRGGHRRPCVSVKASQKFDTEAQAWAYIMEVSGTATRKQAKVAKFEKARMEMQKTFSAMGVAKTGRALYQLTRKSITAVFENILDLIKLKVRSLEILASTLEAHKALREELARTTDIVRIKEIVELIAEENGKNHAMLAFKDKDGRRC